MTGVKVFFFEYKKNGYMLSCLYVTIIRTEMTYAIRGLRLSRFHDISIGLHMSLSVLKDWMVTSS